MSINMSVKEFKRRQALSRRTRMAPRSGPQRPLVRRAPRQQLVRRPGRGQDTGYVDLASGTFNCSTTGTISLINTVAQGASVNQRIGKKIMMKSVQFRGRLQSGNTTTVADAAALLVYDKRPTGALPAITDILVTANSASFNNDVNADRFRIIRRWDWTLTGNDATAGQQTSSSCHSFDEFVSLKGLPQVFNAAGTGAIGDISEGALYLVTVGDLAAGTAAPKLTAAARFRFIDV